MAAHQQLVELAGCGPAVQAAGAAMGASFAAAAAMFAWMAQADAGTAAVAVLLAAASSWYARYMVCWPRSGVSYACWRQLAWCGISDLRCSPGLYACRSDAD